MSKNNTLRKVLTKNAVDVGQALVSLNFPGEVITADLSGANGTLVGEGNILRIQTAGDTFVAFSDEENMSAAITSSTSPAVKLVGAGVHYVLCQCDYVRMSANPTRAELLKV